MDAIVIQDLEVFFTVGVPDAERERPQRLLITLILEQDLSRSMVSDDLSTTIDYAVVVERVLALGSARSWRLIETLAGDIMACIASQFPVEKITIEIKKFILPETRHVAVRITRSVHEISREAPGPLSPEQTG